MEHNVKPPDDHSPAEGRHRVASERRGGIAVSYYGRDGTVPENRADAAPQIIDTDASSAQDANWQPHRPGLFGVITRAPVLPAHTIAERVEAVVAGKNAYPPEGSKSQPIANKRYSHGHREPDPMAPVEITNERMQKFLAVAEVVTALALSEDGKKLIEKAPGGSEALKNLLGDPSGPSTNKPGF